MQNGHEFEGMARGQRELSFLEELWALARDHRKYWLIPIMAVLLLFGILVALSGTAVAPFIYTLF